LLVKLNGHVKYFKSTADSIVSCSPSPLPLPLLLVLLLVLLQLNKLCRGWWLTAVDRAFFRFFSD
jgi:hypothetical protein